MGVSKYVATAIGLALMIWTWDLAHSERGVALEQRREIEATLEETIGQYIKARRPGVTDVVFQQLFSEDVSTPHTDGVPDTKEMLVRFRYLTNEPAENGEMTEQVFEGSVRLRSQDGLNWQWIDEDVRSPIIRYKKGMEINKNSTDIQPGGDPAH